VAVVARAVGPNFSLAHGRHFYSRAVQFSSSWSFHSCERPLVHLARRSRLRTPQRLSLRCPANTAVGVLFPSHPVRPSWQLRRFTKQWRSSLPPQLRNTHPPPSPLHVSCPLPKPLRSPHPPSLPPSFRLPHPNHSPTLNNLIPCPSHSAFSSSRSFPMPTSHPHPRPLKRCPTLQRVRKRTSRRLIFLDSAGFDCTHKRTSRRARRRVYMGSRFTAPPHRVSGDDHGCWCWEMREHVWPSIP